MTLLILLLSCLWTILLQDFFTPYYLLKEKLGLGKERKLYSELTIIDIFIYIVWKILNCKNCMSAHMFWLTYLIVFNSFFGILLCPLAFFLTFIITEKIMRITL